MLDGMRTDFVGFDDGLGQRLSIFLLDKGFDCWTVSLCVRSIVFLVFVENDLVTGGCKSWRGEVMRDLASIFQAACRRSGGCLLDIQFGMDVLQSNRHVLHSVQPRSVT